MFMVITEKKISVDAWAALLDDSAAWLIPPGVHHKLLVQHAGALHSAQMVNQEEYGSMLELADGALAYAIEAQLDLPSSNSRSVS
ncbi:hypothetical protein [Pseudomonas syringae]|uniref:hypothetical protein n=1 Tax=Pseudomonas syringae TaxID=317 RepID=UPI003F838BBF